MTISYILNVPTPSHSPQQDVPNLLINNNSVADWVDVDHFGFNDSHGGQHSQVTFPLLGAGITPPSLNGSVLFSALQTVPTPVNATTQALFQNATSKVMLSCVKAFGTFNTSGSPGALVFGTQFNVLSGVVGGSGLTFSVTLQPNTIASGSTVANTTVIFSANCIAADTTVRVSDITGQVITFTATGNLGTYQISFAVLQN